MRYFVFAFILFFSFLQITCAQDNLLKETNEFNYRNISGLDENSSSNYLIKQIENITNLKSPQDLEIGLLQMQSYSMQLGFGNSAYIKQSGSNHQSILLQNNQSLLCSSDAQLGNEANLWSEGFNTQNIVVQVGNSNKVNQFVENYYATARSVVSIQKGNENEINLALLDGGANSLQGVMVTQTGDSNSAELTLSKPELNESYFKVEQSGGAKIKITHTDFYFPMK